MSIKALIQFFILLLIVTIISAVYFKYFENKKNFVEDVSLLEKNRDEKLEKLEKKIEDLEKRNTELNNKIEDNKNKSFQKKNPEIKEKVKNSKITKSETQVEKININKKEVDKDINKDVLNKKEIKNLVKNVEYTSIDPKGNKFYLVAKSGKSNANNNDLLDLDQVRGEIKSDKRDTIYIVSDFAQYNTINLNSKFYQNVKINFQDKEITCENFDINMETNKAIAYSNVIIEDQKSVMKAGLIEFDLMTKNININPESTSTEIEVISN